VICVTMTWVCCACVSAIDQSRGAWAVVTERSFVDGGGGGDGGGPGVKQSAVTDLPTSGAPALHRHGPMAHLLNVGGALRMDEWPDRQSRRSAMFPLPPEIANPARQAVWATRRNLSGDDGHSCVRPAHGAASCPCL
jgi:hypothetical protein